LKEGIASLIFASPRCSEIPELVSLKKIFEKKYGNDFVSAAIELRPSCGVNRQVSFLRFAFFLVFAYNEERSVSDLLIACLYKYFSPINSQKYSLQSLLISMYFS
jgi:hypothetical protein